MKKEKPYIIYTKKNKEQVIKYLNSFNTSKVWQLMTKNNRGYDSKYCFELADDIEEVIFCNVEIPSTWEQKFKIDENQTVVFKNCTFLGNKLEFIGGEFFVIDSNFKSLFSTISTYGVENLYLKLLKEEKDKEIKCYFYQGKKVELAANKSVKELEIVDYQTIKLSNLDFLEHLKLESNTVEIAKKTHLVVSNLATLKVKNLILGEDSLLYAIGMQIKDVEKIIGTKFKLVSMEDIKINTTKYFNHHSEIVTITNEDLQEKSLMDKRRKLCSQLKGMKDYLNIQSNKELEEQTKILKQKLLQRKINDQYFQ